MILVTGAGGKTGQAVIRALHAAAARVRAMVHRQTSIEMARAAGAEQVVVGDMRNREEILSALAGVEAVYAICPNMALDEFGLVSGLIESAKHVGVVRFVYHSVLHPQAEAMPHHWQKLRVEERLFESGLDFTILQPASYMQNLKGYWDEVVEDGVYRVPYPIETRLSLVDLVDVAQAAAVVLTQAGHGAATYELCGPQALNQAGIAQVMSQAIGGEVQAQEMSVEAWLARPRIRVMDAYARQTLEAMFRYYAAHGLVGNPNELTWLLDRAPATLSHVLTRDFLGQT